MASRSDIRAGRAFVELFVKSKKFFKDLGEARKQLRAFGDGAMSLGRQMMGIGATAAVPLALAARTFANFEDQMLTVQAVSESTEAEYRQLTATAKRLGATTSFTAVEVAQLMTELGKAGFTASEVDEMTAAVLNLSRATGTEAALSAGIMAASIRQFGLGAGDATRVADALTKAANAAFAEVSGLGESLSYAGPVAADFGMSIEETLAILGALGNVGIQGSNAGTAVRRLLTINGAEAEKLNRIFGVTFKDAAGNARPLIDVLEEVNNATKNLGTADRAAKFNEAFGILGITSASAISKNTASVRELLTAIQDAGGVAERTAKQMDSGLGGAFRIMMSAIEGVAIQLGGLLSPSLTTVADTIGTVSTLTIEWMKGNGQLIVTVAKVAAGIVAAGAAIFTLGASVVGLSVLLGAFAAIKTFVVALLPAIVALGAGTAIIGSIVGMLRQLGAQFRFNGEMLGWLGAQFARLREASTAWLRPLISDFQTTWNAITAAIAGGNLEAAAEIAWAGMSLVWQRGVNMINGLWLNAKWYFVQVWTEAQAIVSRGFISTWAGIQRGAIEFVSALKSAWANYKNWSANKMADLYESASTQTRLTKEQRQWYRDAARAMREDAEAIFSADTDAIDSKRKKQLDEINKAEKDTLATFEEDKARADAARNRQYEKDIKQGEDRLAAAERRLEEVRRRNEEALNLARPGGITSAGTRPSEPPPVGGPASAGMARDSFSSFSAAALQAMGGRSGPQQIAKEQLAIEKEAASVLKLMLKAIRDSNGASKELLRQAQKQYQLEQANKLVFTA